jgi:hypothetical protein
VLLGFQQRFEKKILAKEKRHTIRARRKGKRQIRVGDRLDCYIDSRHKSMRLLGRWPCTRVQDIRITRRKGKAQLSEVFIEGQWLTFDEREVLSQADGFQSFADMMEFWRGRLPFYGFMIHWNPDKPQPGPKKGKRK